MNKIVVSGIFTKSYEKVLNLQIKSCKDDYKFDFRFITDEEWNEAKKTKDFAFFGGNVLKTQLVIDKIKENWGQILLIADADLVFFRKTEEQILEELGDLDCIFLKERFSSEPLYEKALANINIGFIAIRCNDRNLKFWEEVQELTQRTLGWDQEVANEILLNKNYDLKWGFFSELFANGGSINRDNIKSVLIGTSCGTIAKRYKFSKYKYLKQLIKFANSEELLWFDEENIIKKISNIIYLKKVNNQYTIRKFLCGLYKTKTNQFSKKYYVLGIQIYNKKNGFNVKSNKLIETVYKNSEHYYYNEVAKNIHQNLFSKYENCYRNKSVVLIACGPSVKYFPYIPGSIYVGVNRAFYLKDIKFDYLFMHDHELIVNHAEELKNYPAEKFCAYHTSKKNAKLYNTTTELYKYINAKRFLLSDCYKAGIDSCYPDVINPNIANGLIYDRGGGTVFSALQFILYTKPKKIYLVGCDCTEDGYFYSEKHKDPNNKDWVDIRNGKNKLLNKTFSLWQEISYVTKFLYPDTEIISLNPVGLKGLFKDVYTEDYIKYNLEQCNSKDIEVFTNETVVKI